ncbi:hypothetical protein L1887_32755 [Cichorium endivia]|nr:hypothetical protein L1887_32755 [Cichorium endivia]
MSPEKSATITKQLLLVLRDFISNIHGRVYAISRKWSGHGSIIICTVSPFLLLYNLNLTPFHYHHETSTIPRPLSLFFQGFLFRSRLDL